jgi:hypothetical protein
MAWSKGDLSEAIKNSAVFREHGFYIVGDAAYPLSDALLTPYKGKDLEAEKDNYNFFQSSLRINIGKL